MKNFLVAIVLLSSVCGLVSCGGEADKAVYGEWKMGVPVQQKRNGVVETTVMMSLRIEKDAVVAIARCEGFGKKLTAEARSAATITDSEIDVKEDKKTTRVDGDLTCSVNTAKGKLSYVVNGNTVTLKDDSGVFGTLIRM